MEGRPSISEKDHPRNSDKVILRTRISPSVEFWKKKLSTELWWGFCGTLVKWLTWCVRSYEKWLGLNGLIFEPIVVWERRVWCGRNNTQVFPWRESRHKNRYHWKISFEFLPKKSHYSRFSALLFFSVPIGRSHKQSQIINQRVSIDEKHRRKVSAEVSTRISRWKIVFSGGKWIIYVFC